MRNMDYEAVARVMKALSSPARLMIIDHLRRGERCICELQPLFKRDKSTVSRHVAALRAAGLVAERRDGVRVYLSLTTPCILDAFACVTGVLKKGARRARRSNGA